MIRESTWFDALFGEHASAIHRYFVRRAARADADDLTADVFVVAWRRRAEVPEGAELAWLYRTAGFVLANHRRKVASVPLHDTETMLDAVSEIPWSSSDDDVRQVLASLSPRDRQILLLVGWEGVSGQDLASVLGISRSASDAALSRARARLREAWEQLDTAAS
jgi:RNA polymerase sigma factor (sigma-70 family)